MKALLLDRLQCQHLADVRDVFQRKEIGDGLLCAFSTQNGLCQHSELVNHLIVREGLLWRTPRGSNGLRA